MAVQAFEYVSGVGGEKNPWSHGHTFITTDLVAFNLSKQSSVDATRPKVLWTSVSYNVSDAKDSELSAVLKCLAV